MVGTSRSDVDTQQILQPAIDDSSAPSPKRLPELLIHYLVYPQYKVIFASDWPVLRQSRVVPEATALDLPADVLDNCLYNNARSSSSTGVTHGPGYELRRLDHSPTEDHKDLQAAYRQRRLTLTARSKVRLAAGVNPLRQESVERLCAMGASSMAIRGRHGDGATLRT